MKNQGARPNRSIFCQYSECPISVFYAMTKVNINRSGQRQRNGKSGSLCRQVGETYVTAMAFNNLPDDCKP